MKSLLLPLLLLLLMSGVTAFGQTRNSLVIGPEIRVVPKPIPPSPDVRPRYVTEQPKLVRPTASVTLTIHNGLPDRQARMLRSVEPSLMMAAGKSMKGHSTGNPLIDAYIVDSSRRYNIDPLLIYAQMAQESSFKLRALSHKGASGLMQLMPATARRMGVTDIYDPKQNIEGGVKYMRFLLDLFGGDINLALAGYNAGEGAVIKYGYRIPPYNETQNYVRIISGRYNAIKGRGLVRKN